jgi:hypothetical protein
VPSGRTALSRQPAKTADFTDERVRNPLRGPSGPGSCSLASLAHGLWRAGSALGTRREPKAPAGVPSWILAYEGLRARPVDGLAASGDILVTRPVLDRAQSQLGESHVQQFSSSDSTRQRGVGPSERITSDLTTKQSARVSAVKTATVAAISAGVCVVKMVCRTHIVNSLRHTAAATSFELIAA